jgi:glycosyltransferase involved in cell wall biosynthesis
VRARAEPSLHRLFGRWAAATLRRETFNAIYSFSGIAEEPFREAVNGHALRVLVRESSHIRTQDRLLREEELRTGIHQERPCPWTIAREEREYGLADRIRVLSSFSYRTFIDEGVYPSKLCLVLSGADVRKFRPSTDVIEKRCQRILGGQPLRVLTVGTFALRKGVWDSAAIVGQLAGEFHFRFVGPVAAEAAALAAGMKSPTVRFLAKQPESSLPVAYAWADVFMLPSIEDGFQAVLAQSAASALPILTTPNGAGTDLIRDGHNGWVLPIRDSASFTRQLRWADSHREELASMVCETYAEFQPRDFAAVAAEMEHVFVNSCAERL